MKRLSDITFGTSSEENKLGILELLIHCFATAEPLNGSLARQGVHSIENSTKALSEFID